MQIKHGFLYSQMRKEFQNVDKDSPKNYAYRVYAAF